MAVHFQLWLLCKINLHRFLRQGQDLRRHIRLRLGKRHHQRLRPAGQRLIKAVAGILMMPLIGIHIHLFKKHICLVVQPEHLQENLCALSQPSLEAAQLLYFFRQQGCVGLPGLIGRVHILQSPLCLFLSFLPLWKHICHLSFLRFSSMCALYLNFRHCTRPPFSCREIHSDAIQRRELLVMSKKELRSSRKH